MNFTHVHVHSSFSPAWGVHTPEALCAAAVKIGMTSLALTDRNGFYAIPRFINAARQAGIAPIIGAEAISGTYRAVLLARDEDGYSNISRLLSELHCRDGFHLPSALQRYRRGVTVITDDREILSLLRRDSPDALYVELSPGHNLHRALSLAVELRIPPLATCRALFLEKRDILLHRVLRAIHLNTKLSRLPQHEIAEEADFLVPEREVERFFTHCPQAVENAITVAGSCKTDWDFSQTIFPAFRNLGKDEAFDELERRARDGALRRFGSIDDTVEARLAKELAIIRAKGFAHYFLVVEELANRSERTCGRGSAAASLVAYCLGITHVDPIRHNLFFERFLNEGRTDPPDIDIDFPWDERDAVLDFAFARYGSQRAAMVANQVGFKGRGALREVAKVYGLPEAEIREVTERISGFWKADRTAGAVEAHPLFQGERLPDDWREIISVAGRLKDHLRHLSLHCGGLVIVPDEIRKYVPVEISAKGLPLIQWEKDQAEDSGLVKIDILGNRSLAVIRDALAAIREHHGIEIDYGSWRPLDDPKTQLLFRQGRTMGCFYVESPSIRQVLRKVWGERPVRHALGADMFEVLVQVSSLIRPAANKLVQEYVARLRGKKWLPPHPLLAEVLDETYGIVIYQEQITQLAMALAGFSAFEGDQLRKIVSKKHKEKKLADFRRQFFEGGRERNVPEAVLEGTWDQILSFAGYSFCKPHSASYVLVSAKATYLKANHPAEFMAAVISNQGGYYSTFAYISESRRLGLSILPPDINESEYLYTGRDGTLQIGLMQIDGLTKRAADDIARERGANRFAGLDDFLRRVPVGRADAERLVTSGCFDALEGREKRPVLLWKVLNFYNGSTDRTPLLFAVQTELPSPPPFDERTVLRQEIESLGMLVSRHPLTLHRQALLRHKPIRASELLVHAGKPVTMIGWWITTKTVQDKHGRPMEFISFEDTTAIFDATFFPDVYAKFCKRLSQKRPYLLKGLVDVEFGVPSLRVKWVSFLD